MQVRDNIPGYGRLGSMVEDTEANKFGGSSGRGWEGGQVNHGNWNSVVVGGRKEGTMKRKKEKVNIAMLYRSTGKWRSFIITTIKP